MLLDSRLMFACCWLGLAACTQLKPERTPAAREADAAASEAEAPPSDSAEPAAGTNAPDAPRTSPAGSAAEAGAPEQSAQPDAGAKARDDDAGQDGGSAGAPGTPDAGAPDAATVDPNAPASVDCVPGEVRAHGLLQCATPLALGGAMVTSLTLPKPTSERVRQRFVAVATSALLHHKALRVTLIPSGQGNGSDCPVATCRSLLEYGL